jgi:hypothetical protein
LSRPPVSILSRAAAPIALALLCLASGSLVGCRPQPAPRAPSPAPAASAPANAELAQTLFDSSISLLDDTSAQDLVATLNQVTERLTQWMELQKIDPNWQPDPLIAKLPPEYASLPAMERLNGHRFTRFDGMHLQESIVLGAVAREHCGSSSDELARATQLFDWVIRNMQLERALPSDEVRVPARPGDALFLGHGRAVDRTWAFVLLCRQQGIDAVVLAYHDVPANRIRTWVPAVVIGDELYLFDSSLGLPIPGPGGQGIATLKQVLADENVLKQLDLDAEHPYPVKTSDLSKVIAWIEGSPGYLSQRMAMVQERLTGDKQFVVSARPSDLAERLRKLPELQEISLWGLPYETLLATTKPEVVQAAIQSAQRYDVSKLPPQPESYRIAIAALRQARMQHLKGVYSGDTSPNRLYPLARIAEEQLIRSGLNDEQVQMLLASKQDASYWLGLVAMDRGNYEPAIDHLDKRTLKASAGGPWTDGARYNLARAYEALGRNEEAIAIYEQDTSPQRHGNRLRARRLKETQAPAAPATPAESSTPSDSPATEAP